MSIFAVWWSMSTWRVVETTSKSTSILDVVMFKNAYIRRVQVEVTNEVLQDASHVNDVIEMLARAECNRLDKLEEVSV